jgi:hypothetical protein
MTSRPLRRRYLALGCIPLLAGAALAFSGSNSPAVTVALAGSSVTASPPPGACTGVTPAVIPALGFIANPQRTQGGHFWWRGSAAGDTVCVGTVVEWVHYPAQSTKTWEVIAYSASHPRGQVVAERTFTLQPGTYWFPFGVHQAFTGLQAVCVTATDSFGQPCVRFRSGSAVASGVAPAASPAPAASSPSAVPATSTPAAGQTPGWCKGTTLAVIPPEGVITNPGQTEGGHLWWRNTTGGTCIGTVIEDVQVPPSAPDWTLRVIVYDQANPGGLTLAIKQITAGPGPVSWPFGIHQVLTGLVAVCLAATSPEAAIPGSPCLSFGQPPPAQQFTQTPATTQTPGGSQQQWPEPWWPWTYPSS